MGDEVLSFASSGCHRSARKFSGLGGNDTVNGGPSAVQQPTALVMDRGSPYWLSFWPRVHDARQSKLRHHHRRRRFRRLHIGGAADRGQDHAGAVARGRRLGSRSVDQDPARLAAAPPQPQARLDVFRRARSDDRRPRARMRARPDHRRLVVDQCHGLCARPPRRLRPLGGVGTDRMVLRPRASLFPPPGILERRLELLSRRRRPADHADGALFRPAGRRLRRCRPRRRI